MEHHTAVYASKNDDRIVRAPRPADLLAHSIATPSLVAAIMNAKYTNAVPLYRLSQEFGRGGVNLSVPTMANWVIRCAERYLQPVFDKLHEELCRLHVVQADETPCQVSKDGRPANARSYMFVYRSGELYNKPGIVLYDYQKTRNADHLEEFLKQFSGILVSDAYSGYHALDKRREDIRIAHCWAHARRDFADAVKLLKKGGPSKQRIKKTIAYQALERIGTMYALEDEWKAPTPAERLSRRQEHMKPLVEAYFAWVKGIDLDIRKGEIFGIGGLAGQGKLGIPNGIMGLYKASGEVRINGELLNLDKLGDALEHKVAFVSEDRRGVGLLLD